MPLSYPTLPGDVDHLIADDHAIVNRLFQHLEEGRGDRRVLTDQVVFSLALHADAEERTIYPAMKKAGMDAELQDALEEHQQAKELCAVLSKDEPGEPSFESALTSLITAIRHHVEDEETEELPALRDKVGAEGMAELGEQFLHVKRTAPTYAHPHGPSSGLGHKVADAGVLLVDKVRDRASGRRHTLATDASGQLNPQAQAIVDAFSGLDPLPIEVLTPELARKQPGPDAAVKALGAEQEPVGSVQDVTIAGDGGDDLVLRLYTPAGEGPFPVLLWIHGGGWVLYDLDTYDASCRGLCNKTQAIVVSPDYRKAPEHVFPASHDDVLATWQWMLGHIIEHGGDPERMAIGGESVGGTMAAATTLQLLQAGQDAPAAQVLVYPLTTGEQYGDSFLTEADARPLNRAVVSWMAMHAFQGVPEGAKDPRVDLLSLPADQLAGFPPTLVITDQRDPLRDQGEEFGRHLIDAGVNAEVLRVEGVMHEFFGAAAVLDEAEVAQQRAAEHLLAHLTSTVIDLNTKENAR
jgi:acetyl esterase